MSDVRNDVVLNTLDANMDNADFIRGGALNVLTESADESTESSTHSGGVNVCLGDGSVRFIR